MSSISALRHESPTGVLFSADNPGVHQTYVVHKLYIMRLTLCLYPFSLTM